MTKGLEALEKVEDFFVDYGSFDETGEYKNYISLYQTPEYQVIRKELKALEIIKKHKLLNPYKNSKLRKMYNLSDEEWDSIKEVIYEIRS